MSRSTPPPAQHARRLALVALALGLSAGCSQALDGPRFAVTEQGKRHVFELRVGPKILLRSDSYKTAANAAEGVRALKGSLEGARCNTTHRVVFKARNHQPLAKSAEPYANKAECEAAIDGVRLAVERASLP